MPAYVIFDVEVRHAEKFQVFMAGVRPAIEQVGAKYLARGGAFTVHDGDGPRPA